MCKERRTVGPRHHEICQRMLHKQDLAAGTGREARIYYNRSKNKDWGRCGFNGATASELFVGVGVEISAE